MIRTVMTLALAVALACLWGCDNASGNAADNGDAGQDAAGDAAQNVDYTNMDKAVAKCEFDAVTFQSDGGALQEVHINGLGVGEMSGADKVSADQWEVVQRRGVRFSDILSKAKITAADDAPINCVARDGWDPLRTKLQNDTSKLPQFAFLRDHGYVYVGSPGDKDPLYPEMEGKSLIVDYDVASDAEVPDYLGGTLAGLGMFRWMMIEKVDDNQRGVIEINPTP